MKPEIEIAALDRITERLREASAQRRVEGDRVAAHAALLAQAARAAILQLDAQGRVLAANARACELFECDGAEALDARLRVARGDLAQALQSMQGSSRSGRATVSLEVAGERPRQLEIDVQRLVPNEPVRFVGVVTDMRAMEVLEADVRLAGQLRDVARAYRTIAHELKAPLSAMLVNVELLHDSLRQGAADDAARERQLGYAKVLQQELGRLNRYLQDLLTEAGSRVQAQEPFDLRALVVDLAELIGAQARRQGVDVTTGLPVETPIVLGHRDRLKEAFLNIVVNALQAMPDGGRLVMHLGVEGERASVRFRDTGPGIPPDILERLNEMGTTTKPGGHGIGLYVARALIELNGGDLRIEDVEHGTTILVELPLSRATW